MEPARDPFVSALVQLLDEERALRAFAEERVRGYMAVLLEMALMLAPEEIERCRHGDPYFPLNLDPAGWREFVQGVRAGRSAPLARSWSVAAANQAGAGGLPAIAQAGDSLDADALGAVGVSQPGAPGSLKEPLPGANAVQPSRPLLVAGHGPAPFKPAPERPHPGSRLTVTLPVLPAAPPEPFAGSFGNWERERLALAALATTGWSNRLALSEVLGDHLGISPSSGSIKRLFDGLIKAGFCQSEGIEYSASPPLRAHILTLTERGRAVMAACGIDIVDSEWGRLMEPAATPEGQPVGCQQGEAALVCAFTYQVRRRGYQTEVCQLAQGGSWPDVEITRDGEDTRVALALDGGEVDGRLQRWRNLADQAGYVAICTTSPETRTVFAAEASRVCEHGKVTDMEALIGSHDAGAIWMQEW